MGKIVELQEHIKWLELLFYKTEDEKNRLAKKCEALWELVLMIVNREGSQTQTYLSEELNDLALKISVLIDGEDCFDAACACALISAFAMGSDASLSKEKRREGLDLLIEFLRDQFEKIADRYPQELN
jgi:hypothetical protein